MRRSLFVLFVALACPTFAHASLVEFTYSYTLGPLSFGAFGPGPISLSSTTNPDGGFTVDHGSGTVTFALASGGSGSASSGSPATVSLGSLSAASNPNGNAGSFSYSSYFNLAVTLTDTASNQSAELPLYGAVFADPGTPGSNVGIGLFGGFWLGVELGDHFYFIMANPEYLEVTPDGEPGPLGLQIFVAEPFPVEPFPVDPFPVDPVGPAGHLTNGGPEQVPEPSTLLLSGSALGLLALARLRRRRGR